jgi:hypothetical protein
MALVQKSGRISVEGLCSKMKSYSGFSIWMNLIMSISSFVVPNSNYRCCGRAAGIVQMRMSALARRRPKR